MTLFLHPFSDVVIMTGDILGYHIEVTIGTLVVWGIALLISLVAEFIVGWRLPYGIIGAFVVGLVGTWLTTEALHFTLPIDYVFHDIPLVKAFLGTFLLVALWHIVTFPFWHRHHYHVRRYARAR